MMGDSPKVKSILRDEMLGAAIEVCTVAMQVWKGHLL